MYTGCFICGGKDHDFRRCPKRGQGKGAAHFVSANSGIYMVHDADLDATDDAAHDMKAMQDVPVYAAASPVAENQLLCYMHVGHGDPEAGRSEGIIPEEALSVAGQLCPGFAVVDSGATETVGSLDALEAVVSMRRRQCGLENVQVFPEAQRNFRFGNGQQQLESDPIGPSWSESSLSPHAMSYTGMSEISCCRLTHDCSDPCATTHGISNLAWRNCLQRVEVRVRVLGDLAVDLLVVVHVCLWLPAGSTLLPGVPLLLPHSLCLGT